MPAGEALNPGDTAEVVIRLADSRGRVLDSGTALIRFWPPGKWSGSLASPRPQGDAEAHAEAAWDSSARGFVALAATDGWPPGRHLALATWQGQTAQGPAKGSGHTEVLIR